MLCLAWGQAELQAKCGLGVARPTPLEALDLLLSPGCQAALWKLHLRGEAWTQAFPPPLLPCPSLPIPAAERRRERELRSIGGAGGGNWELSLELGGWWLGVRSSLHSWESLQRVSVSWGFATPSPFITVHSQAHRLPPPPAWGGLVALQLKPSAGLL